MELIYYRGLNCHLASIINIANSLGANYWDAYAALWSETDFADKAKYNIYVSKRVFAGLKSIGVVIDPAENLPQIPDGEWFLVGMDTFAIPWHPVCGHFHDPHYFFAQKETARSFLCFDPVYNEKHKAIESSAILSAAFDLRHVYKMDANTPGNELAQEATEVLRRHPETKEKLLAEIFQCKGEGKNGIGCLIKQINAMVNNRYLFQHYFRNYASDPERFFDDHFFAKWEAVRNGLYKASIKKDNESVIEEVYSLFADLMHKEINVAKEIIAM